MESVGLTHDHAFDLSLTQTDLGDATGLSVVHVNRTIGQATRRRTDPYEQYGGKNRSLCSVSGTTYSANRVGNLRPGFALTNFRETAEDLAAVRPPPANP